MNVLSGLRTGTATAGWRREASSGLRASTVCDCRIATRSVHPAHGRVLSADCRMATRSVLSGLRAGTVFCDCRMATRSVLSGLRRVLFCDCRMATLKHLIRTYGRVLFCDCRMATSYPAYGRVLFCDCRMTRSALSAYGGYRLDWMATKRLIRPTGEYCLQAG